ncbi:MAG: hypothetical protein ABJN95_17020 [Maribacter sp.]|uniref:plasmid mobilization protein n=1 Tax=Maribacter sp. TaxID=1897614 RepID=UPI003297FDA6
MDQKKRTISGRKKLNHHDKRKRIYLYLNAYELEILKTRTKDAGHKYISEYMRYSIILENYKPRHLNPVEFLNDIKNLSLEVNRVGVNINQIARHLNELRLQNIIPMNVSDAIDEQLSLYIMQQQKIITKLKGVIL